MNAADPTELLSAYLDGELDDSEIQRVESALTASLQLRSELAELAATKTALASLGLVDPVSAPTSLPVKRTRLLRRARLVASFAAAAAVVVLVGFGMGLGRPAMVPDVDALAERHGAVESSDFVAMDPASMDDPALVDSIGLGMIRDGVFQRGDVVQARYSDGEHDISVFHEPGSVDWDSMPEMGERMVVGGDEAWSASMGRTFVLVIERGDLVVTMVADDEMAPDMVMTASAMVPPVEVDRSLWRRLLDAPRNLLDRI